MTTMVEPFAPWLRDLNRLFTTENQIPSFVPPADVIVDNEAVMVFMDVPGISGEQLDIELENDVLTVRGERPYPYGQDGNGQTQAVVRRVERGFGRFERSLRVLRGLDPNSIEASLADGVLTLRLPKPEQLKPHRIQIQGGGGQTQQPQIQGGGGGGGEQPPPA
jgi:HSP20 family protein